jgi:hypothetical protein
MNTKYENKSLIQQIIYEHGFQKSLFQGWSKYTSLNVI